MYRKIILLLVIALQFLFSSIVFAETEDLGNLGNGAGNGTASMTYPIKYPLEVTSPFGWRTHPITGDKRFHSGVDLAGDYGAEIVAAATGTVAYAGWIDGYGNAVIIDHGNGIVTLYGHNQQLCVEVGQNVSEGTIIAYCGSTGNSTGPHCHFEVQVNDNPVDPGLFIPEILTAEIEAGGGNDLDGATDFNGGNLDFEVNVDFAKPVRDLINDIVEVITNALGLIRNSVYKIFMVLLTMDLCLGLMFRSFVDTPENQNEDFINWVVFRLVFYGFCMLLLANWGNIVGGIALHGLPSIGSMAAGSTEQETAAILSDPTSIIQKGLQIISPIMNEALKVKGITDLLMHNVTAILCMVFGLLFFFCFVIIGLQVAKAYLEFYMVILFSFTNFMLSGFKHTRRFASNGLNGVFAVSINLMFFCMFVVMLQYTMENMAVGAFMETHIEESASGSPIKSKEDCMARIKVVESYYGNYHCDNGRGYYGAYQINKGYWDRWCQNYMDDRGNGPVLQTEANSNYVRWSEYGPYDTAPEPMDTYYPWSPQNQDLVTGYVLQGYYDTYHSWEAACRAWTGGTGGMESAEAYDYQAKVLAAKGASSVETVLNLKLLLKLLLVCMGFMFMADRLSKLIIRQFGGMGFKLTNEQ
jgi:hypothetical protein